MVFGQLDTDESAIWSLLLANGYLKPDAIEYRGDIEAVNYYMNKVASEMFSFFDVGGKTGESEPERYYYGFVLGLMAEQSESYEIRSNRESGFGRYDAELIARGISKERIKHYGFAFEGKNVLIAQS